MSSEFLPHFIHEEIYVINEDVNTSSRMEKTANTQSNETPTPVDNIKEEIKVEVPSPPKHFSKVIFVDQRDLDVNQAFLEKVLSAIQLSLASFEIVSLDQIDSVTFDKGFAFGINSNKPNLIVSTDLASLVSNVDSKKKLWTEMKQLF